ncbi:hypothetical protein [Roseovarius indicus]|uniref:hypothetical protein n=1 Tax=Roseovarius indicus TaxID=540747 RepID=UPI0007D9FABB|nr:hypothetical protein [Roseovarius indicus]OAO05879.1 hypothetical protein A8B76_11800 [Roseovarius indicus]
MTEEKEKLSKEQLETFAGWLKEKGIGHRCPVCNSNDWTLGDRLIRSEFFTPNVTTLGGPSMPMAFMLCNNCMYVRQFAAIPIGLVKAEKQEEDPGGE